MTRNIKIFIGLISTILVVISAYLFYAIGHNWEFVLQYRLIKLIAMIVVSCCIAYSSVTFQTLTHNTILTPSIMGFEAVYLLLQTCIVFLFGANTYTLYEIVPFFKTSVLLGIVCMIFPI